MSLQKVSLKILVLAGLVGPTLQAQAQVTVDEGALRVTVETLSRVGPRMAGHSGADRAADYVEKAFHDLRLQDVRREPFSVVVPVDEGGSLDVEGVGQFTIHSLWPNLVRTSTTPQEGLSGLLMYGGEGRLQELEGLPLEGNVLLLEFNSGDRWLTAAMLGVQAILFIEPEETTSAEAEQKFLQVPLRVQRFWIGRVEGKALAHRLTGGPLMARLKARMSWQRRTAWNLFGRLPGSDPALRDQVVVVEAYYDAMSVVPALSPGAEMACSIAGLLEVARVLHARK
ncbi:MAG: hypothetical protein HY709_01780, partial [Candidatus Latescibacteria bacterium]|nr:hypothetical protein [Candidatus Latescibacterota bacterium]